MTIPVKVVILYYAIDVPRILFCQFAIMVLFSMDNSAEDAQGALGVAMKEWSYLTERSSVTTFAPRSGPPEDGVGSLAKGKRAFCRTETAEGRGQTVARSLRPVSGSLKNRERLFKKIQWVSRLSAKRHWRLWPTLLRQPWREMAVAAATTATAEGGRAQNAGVTDGAGLARTGRPAVSLASAEARRQSV